MKKKVAIKRIQDLFGSKLDCKRNLREISLIARMNHESIIKLLDIVTEGDDSNFEIIYLILEYCKSDLRKITRAELYLNEKQVKVISYNFLIGLKYLN